ncbi:MAG: L,D-transpeptidase family protein [Spongiibacteraceae bacterium]
MSKANTSIIRVAALMVCALLAACQSTQKPISRIAPSLPAPVATHEFEIDPKRDDVVGGLQRIHARDEDTLSDIARRFNVGYEEIVSANPGVDPWLPKAGTEIIVPTRFVLPEAPRQGVVINLAAMRLFYFPKAKPGELQKVITHPIGIGRVEWKTPEGTTKVVAKVEAPTWIPTRNIRKEHAANGDPLPAKVLPGPDNPMGTHVLRLGWPAYAIHGTNKPPSIGLRGSHGCMRLYPEDIVRLYEQVPVGTPVTVVNQPYLFGWHGDTLYMQAYPVLEDDKRNHKKLTDRLLANLRKSKKSKLDTRPEAIVNPALVAELTDNPRVLVMPVSAKKGIEGLSLQQHVANTPYVENRVPINATWDGDMSEQLTAAEVMENAAIP